MATVESEVERKKRKDVERESIIEVLEKLKADGNSIDKLVLVTADEKSTGVLSYNFDSIYQLVMSLAIAQSAMVEQLK